MAPNGSGSPATEAAIAAGLVSRNQEAILLALAERRGLVLSTPQIAQRTGLYERSTPGMCRVVERAGLIAHVGKVGKTFTWVATADGYALADLIREELPDGDAELATVVELHQQPPVGAVAAHPATGRVEQEEAIWRWVRQATRADLAGASHRLIDGLLQSLAEEGLA